MEQIGHAYRDMFIVVPIFDDFRYHVAGSESLLGEIFRGDRIWYTGGCAGSQSNAIGARFFGGGQYVIFFFWVHAFKSSLYSLGDGHTPVPGTGHA